MSAGSNNIVVRIADQIDPTIAPKIQAIANAARNANTYLIALQTAVSNVSAGSTKLGQAFSQLQPKIQGTTDGTSRLTGAFAQLTGRVAGAEAGFGMLGGALARVGVAAGVAGPLIIAALAIAAIVGAILIYEKFADAARKLTDAQIGVAEQFANNRTAILEQQEDLIGLTQGPMAKYLAQLNDLSKKEILINISNLTKELEDQKSKWASLVSFVQRYDVFLGLLDDKKASAAPFTIQDAQDFEKAQKLLAASNPDQLKGLQDALVATGQKLKDLNKLEQSETEKSLEITEVSRKGLQGFYQELTDDYTKYLNNHKRLQEGANGEFLAEQRKASQEELRQFNEQLSELKSATGVISPQQELALRQQQLAQFDREHPGDQNQSSPFAATRDTLVKDIGAKNEAIDRQDRSLNELLTKYRDETLASGAYSTQLKIEVEQRKLAAEVERIGPDNTNKQAIIEQGNKEIENKIRDAEISKEKIAIFNQFQGPLDKYNASIAASTELEKKGAISANEKAIADNIAQRAVADSVNPLNEYAIALEHETSLFGIYGERLTAATEVDRIRQELQKQGRDLTAQETTALQEYLTLLDRQRNIQQQVNDLYSQNQGRVEKAVTTQLGLNKAYQDSVITAGQYKAATLALDLQQQDLSNTFSSKVIQALSAVTKGFDLTKSAGKAFVEGMTNAFGTFFQSLNAGLSNSIARFLVFNEALGKSLLDVARNAVSELISSLIELGIQFLVVTALEKAFHIKLPKKDDEGDQLRKIGIAIAGIAAITLAQLTAISVLQAPAWDLAEAISLISFGANAAGAVSGISAVVAAGSAAQASGGGFFAQGGFVGGPRGTDNIPAWLTAGEFVVRPEATTRNRGLLESINRGSSAVTANSRSGNNTNLQVVVQHDGSTAIQVDRMDDNRVRIIAKQQAEQAVIERAPGVIASDLGNPNSRTSKSMRENHVIQRRR